MKISIIGTGRLGGALAIALANKNLTIENLAARNPRKLDEVVGILEKKPNILTADNWAKITSDVVLIATQDSEIEKVVERLSETLTGKPTVLHTSGALSSEILGKLRVAGCPVGSIHPLVSISDARLGAARFAGAFFCVEGDKKAVRIAGRLVEKLDGRAFSIAAEFKALYHASAVTASGHLVALFDVAIEMLTKCGLNEPDARGTLLPLVSSTVENLKNQTPARALTGTFARADVKTLERHLEILSAVVSPEALEIYLQLGVRSLRLAEDQGVNQENIEKMRGQIMLAKKNLKC